MPLVRIDVVEGRRSPEQLRLLADTVQEVMLDVFAAPPRDRYQVLTEHRPGQLIREDTGLGIERTILWACTRALGPRTRRVTAIAAR